MKRMMARASKIRGSVTKDVEIVPPRTERAASLLGVDLEDYDRIYVTIEASYEVSCDPSYGEDLDGGRRMPAYFVDSLTPTRLSFETEDGRELVLDFGETDALESLARNHEEVRRALAETAIEEARLSEDA
jgi:hypothetical protein